MQVLALNYLSYIPFRFQVDRSKAVGFLSFGSKLFSSGLIIFLIFNADNAIIGTIAGASMLGFYALAFNWGSFFCSVLSETVHNVLFPAFSRAQKDKPSLKNAYLKVLEYVSMIGVMVNINLIVNSKEILFYVFGRGTDKWLPAVSALQILSIYGIVRIILEPVGNVVLAMGRPGILLKANLLAGIVEIALLYPTVKYFGINGVAILVTGAYALQYLIYLPFLKMECGIEPTKILAAIKPSLICGLAIAGSAFMVGGEIGLSITSMIIKFIYCVGGYLFLYGVLTKWRTYKEARSIFNRIILSKVKNNITMEA